MMPVKSKSQQGFTLIEVLIASAIAIAAMGLLLQLFNSGLDRLNRVSLNAKLIIAEKEVVNRLQWINPALASNGRGVVEGLEYRWQAEVIEPFQPVSEALGEAPYPRYIALYQISVDLVRSDGFISTFNITRMGWKATQ